LCVSPDGFPSGVGLWKQALFFRTLRRFRLQTKWMIDSSLTLERLNARLPHSMVGHLAIEFIEIGPDYLVARMPVDQRTVQPIGILHGGASAALAETVGSMAAYCSVDRRQFYCVGIDLKCNHLRPVRAGFVVAKAEPLHLGRRTHLWDIRITNAEGKLVCYCTHTVSVLPLDEEVAAVVERRPL
jgi:uncharacterized protein (TIGR00369 family)